MANYLAPVTRLLVLALLFFAPVSFSRDGLRYGPIPHAAANGSNSSPSGLRRLKLLAERDAYYEQCATICQAQVDEDINRCPGAREIQKPNDSSPPLPQCKRNAVDRFERCMQRCPTPPAELQG